jgi:uncharacterized protein with GYD domain
VVAACATLGRFDYVHIVEMSDSKAGWEVLIETAMQGDVSAETTEILPLEEFLQIVARR